MYMYIQKSLSGLNYGVCVLLFLALGIANTGGALNFSHTIDTYYDYSYALWFKIFTLNKYNYINYNCAHGSSNSLYFRTNPE